MCACRKRMQKVRPFVRVADRSGQQLCGGTSSDVRACVHACVSSNVVVHKLRLMRQMVCLRNFVRAYDDDDDDFVMCKPFILGESLSERVWLTFVWCKREFSLIRCVYVRMYAR